MKNTTRSWQIVALLLTSAIIAWLLLPSTCNSDVNPIEITTESDTVYIQGRIDTVVKTVYERQEYIGKPSDFTNNVSLSDPVIGKNQYYKSLHVYDFDIPSLDTTFTLSGQVFIKNNAVEAMNVVAHGYTNDTVIVYEPDTIVITNDITKTEGKVKR